MSWRTSPTVLALRNIGRVLGANRVLSRLLSGAIYEDHFRAAMLHAIRPGDVVWDVGANVGLYSMMFADVAGLSGKVIAFEPSPQNLIRLHQSVAQLRNVAVVPLALGGREETVVLAQGNDLLGATSHIVDRSNASDETVVVRLSSGDSLVFSGLVETPNVIKIDTEGFELDVLHGLSQTLQRPAVRALGVEIHFQLLNERGFANAPSAIERILVSAGFAVVWPDASHIVATRII